MREAFYKLNKLLSTSQKRQAVAVFGLMVVAAVLEFLSVTLFLPFVAILAQPNLVFSNAYLSQLCAVLGITSVTKFTILLGLIIALVIWTSMLVRALNVHSINRFGFSVLHALALDMMRLHLARDYSFYLNKNTGDLAKTVLVETEKVIRGILFPAMRILLHAVVAIFLMALLVLISPVVAIVTSLALGACIGGIYLAFRQRTLLAGREIVRANTDQFRQANEVFGGIKELRLLGRENGYLSRFGLASLAYSNATARCETTASMPMFFVQAIAISVGIAALLYLVWSYGDLGAALPSIAAFAYGAYRLMPSLQSMASEISVVRYSIPTLDAFYADYESALRAKRERIDTEAEPVALPSAIDVRGLEFRYGPSGRTILSGIDLKIKRGESIGIVGSSGSGKSTLVDIIVGLLRPTTGGVFLDEKILDAINVRGWRRSLGYVPQTIFLSDDTIRANIAFGVPEDEIDHAAVVDAARRAHLHEFVSRELEAGYDTIVGERGIRLSGGQRQRISIARALYGRPSILIFDEATSALDNETEAAVMGAIEALRDQLTLITVAHRLSTVEPYDRIYVLDGGRVVGAGTYAFLSQHNNKFKDLLRSPRTEADTAPYTER